MPMRSKWRGADVRRTPKAPGLNRSVPIFDRRVEGLSGPTAAWRTVRAVTGAPTGTPRPLPNVAAVLTTMEDGTPVVLTAKLPRVPTLDGYLIPDGHGRTQTVTLVAYSRPRQAVRVTPSLGIGWGQMGRAWLSLEALGQALAAGGRAYAPRPK